MPRWRSGANEGGSADEREGADEGERTDEGEGADEIIVMPVMPAMLARRRARTRTRARRALLPLCWTVSLPHKNRIV